MTKGKFSGDTVNLYTFKVDEKRLRAKVRDLQGRFISGNQAVLRANQASLQWLAERAANNLEKQVKRAPDRRNKVRLADVIRNPDASYANIDGFQFLVRPRVRALSRRAASYYRAVEYGSNYWVMREHVLIFYGPSGPGGQAAYGLKPIRGRGPVVLIENPVPAYRYATMAWESFIKSGRAGHFINRELKAIGLPVR